MARVIITEEMAAAHQARVKSRQRVPDGPDRITQQMLGALDFKLGLAGNGGVIKPMEGLGEKKEKKGKAKYNKHNLSPAELAEREASGIPDAARMNKGEFSYALRLQADPNVARFRFEGVKLRLGDNCHITFDFYVVTKNGKLQQHEVKGRRGGKYHAEEDALVKLKTAPVMYPEYEFYLCWPGEFGAWNVERRA